MKDQQWPEAKWFCRWKLKEWTDFSTANSSKKTSLALKLTLPSHGTKVLCHPPEKQGVKEISWGAGKWGGVIISVRGAVGFREAALNHSCLFHSAFHVVFPFFGALIVGVASTWFLQSLIFLFQSVFLQLKLGNYEFIKRQPVMGAGTVWSCHHKIS